MFKRPLNLRYLKPFNEKFQWLKLYNRKNEYTEFVVKSKDTEYIANKVANEHVIHTLGAFDSFSDIDFSNLPNSFVIKCTHDSGGLVICKDKNFLILIEQRKIEKCLHTDFYLLGREWLYKNVKHRIIEEETGSEIKDYKGRFSSNYSIGL